MRASIEEAAGAQRLERLAQSRERRPVHERSGTGLHDPALGHGQRLDVGLKTTADRRAQRRLDLGGQRAQEAGPGRAAAGVEATRDDVQLGEFVGGRRLREPVQSARDPEALGAAVDQFLQLREEQPQGVAHALGGAAVDPRVCRHLVETQAFGTAGERAGKRQERCRLFQPH